MEATIGMFRGSSSRLDVNWFLLKAGDFDRRLAMSI